MITRSGDDPNKTTNIHVNTNFGAVFTKHVFQVASLSDRVQHRRSPHGFRGAGIYGVYLCGRV